MALKIPRCARCSGACELKTLQSISAEHGPLKLTLLEMPVFACAKAHKVPVKGASMLCLFPGFGPPEVRSPAGREEEGTSRRNWAAAGRNDLQEAPVRRLQRGAFFQARASAGVPVRTEVRRVGAVQNPDRNAALQVQQLRQGATPLNQGPARPRPDGHSWHQRWRRVPA